LWWDIRPSARYPTLEMRSSDICTRYKDGITIAALYQALLVMLYQRRMKNQKWRVYSRLLIAENNWRAQRYGVDESLIDFGRGELVPMAELMTELVGIVEKQSRKLGSFSEVSRISDITANGTSADRQRRVRNMAFADGADEHEALVAVVDHLIDETLEDL
ncbi:MAG: carboxylate-amine ligase, partial [Acidimicrobiia bacterium]